LWLGLHKHPWLISLLTQTPILNPMPERKNGHSKQGEVKWWVPGVIGVLLLMVPGGLYVSPVFFILAIIMKARNKPRKNPQTPPHSLP